MPVREPALRKRRLAPVEDVPNGLLSRSICREQTQQRTTVFASTVRPHVLLCSLAHYVTLLHNPDIAFNDVEFTCGETTEYVDITSNKNVTVDCKVVFWTPCPSKP